MDKLSIRFDSHAIPVAVSPELAETRPTVLLDIHLGTLYSDVDFDVDAIAERMRQEGIPDHAIANSEILLTANNLETTTENTTTLANYNPRNDKIEVSGTANAASATGGVFGELLAENSGKNDLFSNILTDSINSYASDTMGEHIYHEIRHMRQKYTDPKMDIKYVVKDRLKSNLIYGAGVGVPYVAYGAAAEFVGYDDNLTSWAVVGLSAVIAAYAQHRRDKKNKFARYRQRPSEIDARQAQAEADKTVVSLQLRQPLLVG